MELTPNDQGPLSLPEHLCRGQVERGERPKMHKMLLW